METADMGRKRARQLGIAPGILAPGALNAITDVAGVRIGNVTRIEGQDVRTGATAILPHAGNLFQEKVPCGLAVGNGYGKLAGSTQLVELGELETPILLTNTLAVDAGLGAILDWTLAQPGNEQVLSVNGVVGETNDGYLNDIRRRVLTPADILPAITRAVEGPVPEGTLGAGTGTVAFGWKGGLGSSSRCLPERMGGYCLGVLVQTNFGGVLQMDGLPVGRALGQHYLKNELAESRADGSVMIVLATDAPLSDRNLARLARRALGGLARTGASLGDGSGDYALAFSTAESVRRTPHRRAGLAEYRELPNPRVSPLFQAAIEATEEAIYNSLCMATGLTGYLGHTVVALPLERVAALLKSFPENSGD
jgi:D-aminopeptidase